MVDVCRSCREEASSAIKAAELSRGVKARRFEVSLPFLENPSEYFTPKLETSVFESFYGG